MTYIGGDTPTKMIGYAQLLQALTAGKRGQVGVPRPAGQARVEAVNAAQAKVNEHLRRIQASRKYGRRR